jgi:hypothetical protein
MAVDQTLDRLVMERRQAAVLVRFCLEGVPSEHFCCRRAPLGTRSEFFMP